MTADWFDFPPNVLRKISSRITNEVEGINRVTYDISSKPPAVCRDVITCYYLQLISRTPTDRRVAIENCGAIEQAAVELIMK